MGQITDIINGNVNEVFEGGEELKDIRMKICKECSLYKETSMGPICNSRLYINEDDKTTISDRQKIGYKRGCGCVLNRKTKLPHGKCIIEK